MSVTIKEIAQVAGISRGTVDRVLHNRPGVKSDVAERIRYIAEKMGYVPNRAGKVLAARKQPISFGCLLPSIGNPFFEDIINGFHKAEQELADFGVSVKIEQVKGFDEHVHIAALKRLVQEKHSGLCLTTIDVPEVQSAVHTIIEEGTPVISVNTDIPDTNRLCYVGPDYFNGGKTAAGMLAITSNKPLRLLIATGSFYMRGHNERVRGFSEGMKEKGLSYVVAHTFESLDDDEHAYTQTLKILQEKPDINCIFIAAAGVEGVCRAVKRIAAKNTPKILSFDDTPVTRKLVKEGMINFTICQEPVQQGYIAISKLFSFLMGVRRIMPEDYITETLIKISENI